MRKEGYRRFIGGIAGLAFLLSACGPAEPLDPLDPCDAQFIALQQLFKGYSSGTISGNKMDIEPSSLRRSIHPPGWINPIVYLNTECKDKYEVTYVGSGAQAFSKGVVVEKKSTGSAKIDISGAKEVSPSVVTIVATMLSSLIALFGLSRLKKAS